MLFYSPVAETRVRKWAVANTLGPKSEVLESEERTSEGMPSLEKSRFNEAYLVPFYWGALDG